MDDWLSQLNPGDRVLDLASAGGSFSVAGLDCSVIAIDEDLAALQSAGRLRRRVAARLERLPIASASIDLVICNHALEHVLELCPALDEIGRVLNPAGRLYVAVPDGHAFCDGLYRWLFEGGGHVNRFRRDDLVGLIEARVGLRLAQSQKLYSSLGYLRGIPDLAAHSSPDLQRRLQRIGRLPRRLIHAAQAGLYIGTRVVDRCLGTSLAIYGWALRFDRSAVSATPNPPYVNPPYVNVCMYCGAGHPPNPSQRPFHAWSCDSCGRTNRFWFG